jgi:tetratricopeptide (TPR) repeat protein
MKMVFCLVILVTTTWSFPVLSQKDNADSLRIVLRKDTTNFEVLMELTKSLVDVENMEALKLATRAKALAFSKSDTSRFVYSSRVIGQLYNRLGYVDLAIKEFTPLLPIAEKYEYKRETKKILNSLANALMYKGEYDKALEYHFRSLVLREKEGNKQDIGVTLNNIGLLYYTSSNYELALIYLKKCLGVKTEIGDSLDLDRLYVNLGISCSEIGNYKDADVYFENTVKTCEPHCSNSVLIPLAHAKGRSLMLQKKLAEASKQFNDSYLLAVQNHDTQFQLENLISLAQIALYKDDLISLCNTLSKIESLPGTEQFAPALQLFYGLSAEYYSRVQKFREAYLFQKKYFEMGEKINSPRVNKKIMDIETRFIERENFQKLDAQEKLLFSQNQIIQKQRLINILFLGIATLTASLIIVLFTVNNRKTRVNKILDQLVKDRTLELENNRNELSHAYNEQKIVLERFSSGLIASLATIEGLKNLLANESGHSNFHIKEIEKVLVKSLETISNSKMRNHG